MPRRPRKPRPTLLGQFIAARRGELGITLDDVAKRAGLTKQNIQHLERGSVRDPRASTMVSLGVALRVPPVILLGLVDTYNGPQIRMPTPHHAGNPGVPKKRRVAKNGHDDEPEAQAEETAADKGEPGGRGREVHADHRVE